eukprot:5635-Heterococcus_DN1.PRE.1
MSSPTCFAPNYCLKHACTCKQVDTKTKKLEAGPWRHSNVGKAATMLVPVPEPLKGVLVLGEQTVTYIDGIVVKATPIDQ